MKKVGLFLLAVFLIAGVIGCSGGDDNGSITIYVTGEANCVQGVATGTIANTNTGWTSATITVEPGARVPVEVPEEGTYRFQFKDNSGSWDFTGEMQDGDSLNLTCGGKTISR